MAPGKYVEKLKGTRVLIFGGTSGIGFGISEASIEYGAHVTISGSSQAKLDKAIASLKTSYPHASGNVQGFLCDLSNTSTIEANLTTLLKAATNDGVHKINHITFSAGNRLDLKPLAEVTPDNFQALSTVRVIAPLMLAKLIPTYMQQDPDSSFTLTSGVSNTKPTPGRFSLSTWGGAIEGLTRGLALDLAPVRVNCVAPGAVKTEMLCQMPPHVLEHLARGTIVKRLGKPEDVVEAYMYPMKDGNVTGTILHSSGGKILA